MEHRQIAEYVTRAREWILKTAARTNKVEAIGEAITFYREVIADKKNDLRDRLDARKQLDLIFGTHAPKFAAIREFQPQQTPADDGARALAPTLLIALETVYGGDAAQNVIDIATEQRKAIEIAAPANKKSKLKLA